MSARVWIVYTEYQNSDPAINGVFVSKAAAEACAAAEKRTQLDEYENTVFGIADDETEDDWDVDIHIEEWDVQA